MSRVNEMQLQAVKQEMMAAGRARSFGLARRKEEELQNLESQLLVESLPSKDPEDNIRFLNVEIDKCVDAQKWAVAQSLQLVVTGLARQAELSKSPKMGEGKEQEKCTSDEISLITEASHPFCSSTDGESPICGHITVLQSQPLVWASKDKLHKCPKPPNFDRERKTIAEALNHAQRNGGHIDVSFEPATAFQLNALLASKDNSVLHYSGHGFKDGSLSLENLGALQMLGVDDLEEYVSNGSKTLQLVFVSSCYSRKAGDAFVAGGVPHVVCVEQDTQLPDDVAIEFTWSFYLQLALGRTVRQAFNMAKTAVKIALDKKDAKFVLLPEMEEDDDSHNVMIFDSSPVENHFPTTSVSEQCISMLPPWPTPFFGRDIEMYNAIGHLKNSRFFQISGESGIGKSALGQAMCSYVAERKDTFFFEDVIWLPSLVSDLETDGLKGRFDEIIGMIGDDQVSAENPAYRQRSGHIAENLHDRRSLIFIDGCYMAKALAMAKLRRFLEVLLNGTKSVHIVFISPAGEEMGSKVVHLDAGVKLGPLDMRSSALLFGNICPFVLKGTCPEVRTSVAFANLLVPLSQENATRVSKSMTRQCQGIFGRIGEGVPEWICSAAEKISASEYLELVDMGKRQEFQRGKYDTRVALEQEWGRIAEKFEASKQCDFFQAELLHEFLQELDQLREDLPTLEELRSTEKDLCLRRDDARSIEDFKRAGKLQNRLSECREKIKQEEEALVGNTGNESTGVSYANPRLVQNKTPGDCAGLLEVHGKEELSDSFLSEASSPSRINTVSLATSLSNHVEYSVPFPGSDVGSFTLVVSHMSVTSSKHSNPRLSAIVCATNEGCLPVPGTVSGAIIDAGGETLKKQVENLTSEEKSHWGAVRCPTGESRIVGPAELYYYGELNVRYVIFTVGPTYSKGDGKDSLKRKETLLRSAYRSSLELAKKEKLESVAFSLVSCGQRSGNNLRTVLRIAVEVIATCGYPELKQVELCAFKKREADLLKDIVHEMGLPQLPRSLIA